MLIKPATSCTTRFGALSSYLIVGTGCELPRGHQRACLYREGDDVDQDYACRVKSAVFALITGEIRARGTGGRSIQKIVDAFDAETVFREL
ncbi:hypothetical protein BD309DRAFT_669958 [Dichomitus squalens]|nr:hypothetical protein BD309DRAFT_669958 [Dichomitus squalens]